MSEKLLFSALLFIVTSGVKAGGPSISTNPNGQHSMFLCSDGTVWTWGRNSYGQLGNNTTTNQSAPVQVRGPGGSGFLTSINVVSAGAWFSAALRSDGTVWTWGYNGYGQLGNNSTVSSVTPVQVTGPGGTGLLTNITAIQACGHYALAVRNDGTVWAWGYNNSGRLGDNTTITRLAPVQVLGPGGSGFLTNIIALGAGGGMSMSLRNDGTVWTWGFNSSGQLGNNSTVTSLTPVQVKDGAGGAAYLTNVALVASGDVHGMAMKNDGTLWTWGNNGGGRLGDGTITNRLYAVQVVGPGGSGNLSNIISATGGYSYSMALKDDGTVWTWGYNTKGQLGINSTTGSYTPVQALGIGGSGNITNIVSVSCGGNLGNWDHAMALRNDGAVLSWGGNTYGQVGDGSTTDRWTPVLTTASWGGACGPLPVELVSLQGNYADGSVTLTWITASEINNAYFTIERSFDGTEFAAIGAVNAAGNSSLSTFYEFTDPLTDSYLPTPVPLIYYRLKQFDYDGNYTFTEIVKVRVNPDSYRKKEELAIRGIYISGGVSSVRFTIPLTDDAVYEILDLTGNRMLAGNMGRLEKGYHTARIATGSLPSGIYGLILKAGWETAFGRMLIY